MILYHCRMSLSRAKNRNNDIIHEEQYSKCQYSAQKLEIMTLHHCKMSLFRAKNRNNDIISEKHCFKCQYFTQRPKIMTLYRCIMSLFGANPRNNDIISEKHCLKKARSADKAKKIQNSGSLASGELNFGSIKKSKGFTWQRWV